MSCRIPLHFVTEKSGGRLRFEYNATSDTGTLHGKANDFAVTRDGLNGDLNV